MKSKTTVFLIHVAALICLSTFLLLLGNTVAAVFLIAFVWILALFLYFLTEYVSRRKYFGELMDTLERLKERYLIAEVMKPSYRLEDKLYWEVLRKSNKAVMEKIHELEDGQREYKEYIERWVHEVKTPITAIHLICENQRDDFTKRIQLELDDIEAEVEKVLYYARMEQVYRDYLIHPVNLRETVLSAIRGEKRRFIACGMRIDLDLEDTVVSTDEKWVEFILRQIFSNSMKYRRETGAKLRIYMKEGEKQKSLILEDNGCGIPDADIGRVFDKGFTGENGRKKNRQATGMGLYLCRRLCDKLGIGLSCESRKGEYTRMILTFPDTDFHAILQK